jgi:hypothetical protein
MPVVYRIQDKHGRWPWKPGFSHKWVESRDDHKNLLPSYQDFSTIFFGLLRPHIGCGCATIEQLQRWFTESEYKTLMNYGYMAVKLNVDEIIAKSDTQLLFRRNLPLRKKVVRVRLYDA